MGAEGAGGLKASLVEDERFTTIVVHPELPTAGWVDRALRALDLPRGVLVALVSREGTSVVPDGDTVLRVGDRLTVIGSPEGVREVVGRYGAPTAPAEEEALAPG